ncbi:MAG: hypothetical protein GY788_21040 [bacterium]|nr:hypothetical protein [bacterium]
MASDGHLWDCWVQPDGWGWRRIPGGERLSTEEALALCDGRNNSRDGYQARDCQVLILATGRLDMEAPMLARFRYDSQGLIRKVKAQLKKRPRKRKVLPGQADLFTGEVER